MVRRITKYGEQILKTKAAEVTKFDENLRELGSDLVETMYAENGLGLAAPQIGESKRVFAIDMRRRVEKDIWYIEHWSFWLDIQIMFKTVADAIHGDDKAY